MPELPSSGCVDEYSVAGCWHAPPVALRSLDAPHTRAGVGAYYNGPKFKCQPTSGTG